MNRIKITKVAQLDGHRDSVYAMGLDRERGKIFSAGADGFLVEWDWPHSINGRLIATIPEPAYSLCVTPEMIYWGSSRGNLYLIRRADHKLIRQIKLHQKGIFDISCLGNYAFTAGGDGMLMRLDSKGELLERTSVSGQSLRKLLPALDRIWIAGSDSCIRLYELGSGQILQNWCAHRNSVFDLVELGGNLYSTGRDARILQWDFRQINPEPAKSVDAHRYTIHSLAVENGPGLLLSGSMDKSIRIWTSGLELIREVNAARDGGHTNAVNKVLWIDPNHFISCSDDRALMLFQAVN